MSDTRTTDYALGELTGGARDEFERELAVSDALQVELTDTIKMVTTLGYLPPSTECFDAKVRSDLLRACEENQAAFRRKKTLIRWGVPLGLAAAASVIFLPNMIHRSVPTVWESSQQKSSSGTAYYEPVTSKSRKPEDQRSDPATKPAAQVAPIASALARNGITAPHVPQSRDQSLATAGSKFQSLEASGLIDKGRATADQKRFTQGECADVESHTQRIPFGQPKNVICNARNGGRFVAAKAQPQSAYSFQVDISGYAKIRKEIERGQLPLASSVHIEDLINAFAYDYVPPNDGEAFSVNMETGKAPWDEDHLLVRVGIQGRNNSDTSSESSTLEPIARNVHVEIDFNPAQVASYRLVGYEQEGVKDKKINTMSEVYPGFTHTALYEIVLAESSLPHTPPQNFQRTQAPAKYQPADMEELFTLKLHHCPPGSNQCRLLTTRCAASSPTSFEKNSTDFRFAAAVAAFGMKLRPSPESPNFSWPNIQQIALTSLGNDFGGQRSGFASLVEKASRIQGREISAISAKKHLIALGWLR